MRVVIAVLFLALAGCVSPAAIKIDQGTEAANRGDLATAEALVREGLQLGPTAAERAVGINNLGTFALRRGDRDEAIRAWTLAARMGDPSAIQNLYSERAPVPTADLAVQASSGGGSDIDSALLLYLANQPTVCTHQMVGSYGRTSCR